jgi:hypothetical protein
MHFITCKYPCQAQFVPFVNILPGSAGPVRPEGPIRAFLMLSGPARVSCLDISRCQAPGCDRLVSGPGPYCEGCDFVLRRC